MVHTIRSNADFDRKLSEAGGKLVVVDFYATWCGPCKDIDPVVKSLERKYSGKAMVLKVNVDKFEEIAAYYKIRCMPSFVFIKNKKKLGGFSGADEDKLANRMAKLTTNIY